MTRLPGQVDSVGGVGASQTADLAELKDWVEGIRAAANEAREEGNLPLAKALDMTRFEVYESYLDEEYTRKSAKRLVGRGA
jgi:ArsR family metal-binding transcriptional regulator